MTWKRIIASPVLLFALLAAALTAAVAAFNAPTWLIVATAVVTAVSGALAAVRQVTPLKDPRDNEGRSLTP